jgi:predicted PurR-regulated permease PerM
MRPGMPNHLYKFTYVLILTTTVLVSFLFVIRGFLIDVVLAAIFAGLLYPLFERTQRAFGGRRTVAASVIVVVIILAVALPFAAFMALVGSQAIQLSQATVEWIQQTAARPDGLADMLPQWLVVNEGVSKAIASVTLNIADIIGALAGFLSRSLSSVTLGAMGVLLDLFVIAFGVVYFLQSGPALLDHFMERIPVAKEEARIIGDKTLQVTAATLKSVVIGGAVQGALVGLGFAVAGIGQPWFWGAVAAAASAFPAFGAGLVWTPGAIYLLLTGHGIAGLGLLVWGGAVVASADNVLRIYIVGRTEVMQGFLVLVSTLGGLAVLGPSGILIGPVLAGMLLGMLDLYYSVLKSSGLLDKAE